MPVNTPVLIAGVVERYFPPEETRPGKIVLRPDDQDESVDLKIWLDRESRAKPKYLVEIENQLGDVHMLEGQRIMAQARPSGEWEGRSKYNLVAIKTDINTGIAPATPTPAPAPTPAPQVAAPTTGWTDSTRLQIAWNSAINNAVNTIPYDQQDWRVSVDETAQLLYALILRGPVPPVEEVEEVNPFEDSPNDQGVMKV